MAPKSKLRLCACGCGQLAARKRHNGRNKGWHKYAEGHQPRPALCDPKILAKTHANQKRTWDARLPVGSRRVVDKGGKLYYEIKVAGKRRWPLEHRHIMETRIGRKLRSDEHVHHRDDNGLNNGLNADGGDNLQLLSASDHMRLTNLLKKRELCTCTCPHCGSNSVHFKKTRND